jgi:uncharacterized phage protein (TIGR01671 family)
MKIKFRVWDGKFYRENLKRYYLNLMNGNISQLVYNDEYDEYYDAGKIGEVLTIEQYTGLKDKNGKEIYEGDIIHYVFDGDSYPKEATDVKLVCVYDDKNGWFAFNESPTSEFSEYLWYEIENHCEVIGNIHENPELLQK